MFGWARGESIGVDEAPISHENYKRAVYRQPPSRFMVVMLPPTKQSSTLCHGMHVTAITRGDRSSVGSGSSSGSIQDYEIWRPWEDCLWFQDSLEVEYSRLARMKRQRLKAGKGVKKNGLYLQDQASSWESLPPGPEPNSVASDIHAYIPKLTKKGTLFKPSQETIDQRQTELTAFVAALFSDEIPTLLQDLRKDRIVTDFFGYWRRDHDLAMKQTKVSKSGPRAPSRTSITGSILSSYFAPSMGSLPDSASTRTRSGSDVSRTSFSSSVSTFRRKPKEHSNSDSSSSSGESAVNAPYGSGPAVVSDAPLEFSHNPISASTPRTALSALPEDIELSSKDDLAIPTRRPPRASIPEDQQMYRNTTIFGSVQEGLDFNDPKSIGFTRGARDSWQTTGSATTFLEGLDMVVPSTPKEMQHRRPRNSMASVATFMTDASADGVVPRNFVAEVTTNNYLKRSSSDSRKARRESSVSVASDMNERWSDDESHIIRQSFLNSFPVPGEHLPLGYAIRPMAPPPPDSPPDTPQATFLPLPDADFMYSASDRPSSAMAFFNVDPYSHPPSRLARRDDMPEDIRHSTASSLISNTFTTVSGSTGTETPMPTSPTISITTSMLSSTGRASPRSPSVSSPTTSDTSPRSTSSHITVKVAHNQSIIMVRVTRDATIEDVKYKIKEKFSSQEGIELSEGFTLAIALPSSLKPLLLGGRSRSNSLSSLGGVQMKVVVSQADWDKAVDNMDGPKLALKVLDSFA